MSPNGEYGTSTDIDGHWFPIQLNTNIISHGVSASTGSEQAAFIGIEKSYHKNIVLNPDLVKRQFSYTK
ncbi:MAG: hypothetical protein B7C24_14600 [Bacteroidetes bacterium 4572_77]|nr:MAG: hypothetical protein B7C24_14600 [Bacteroidetes bacterium 4572_77]